MIIGYEMYRNLTQGRNTKSKKLKETFQKTLVDPGTVLCFNPQVEMHLNVRLMCEGVLFPPRVNKCNHFFFHC